jgi:hypothetical protein
MYPTPLDLNFLPVWLSGVLGIDIWIALPLSAGLILMMFFLVMSLIHTPSGVMYGFLTIMLAFFTSLGWLPYYFWILIVLFVAIRVSSEIKGWF